MDNQPVVENFAFKATIDCFGVRVGLLHAVIACFWVCAALTGRAQAAPLRVVSLDMCADAYGLGLLPPEAVLAVSKRGILTESYYRDRALRHRTLKPSLEAILALKPDAVLRTWGGDISLINALSRHNIKVIQINDINDFSQARVELLRVGEALGAPDTAKAQARLMDQSLSVLPRSGQGKSALYYTSQSFTAGAGTWPGHLIETLGYRLANKEPGFSYISPEAFLNQHPNVYALGYFDKAFGARHAPGRHPLVRKHMQSAATITLPATALSCGAWYAAFALKEVGRP